MTRYLPKSTSFAPTGTDLAVKLLTASGACMCQLSSEVQVQTKLILMEHPVPSCHVPVVISFHLVQDFGIVSKYLLCLPCRACTHHLVLSLTITFYCEPASCFVPNSTCTAPKFTLICRKICLDLDLIPNCPFRNNDLVLLLKKHLESKKILILT